MRELIRIEDPGDPRIEPYRDVRERDLVGRQGRFIVEGRVTLGVLARHGRYPVESVLLAEGRAEVLKGELATLPESVAVYAAAQAVMDTIVGFHLHRGVLAVARRGELRGVEDVIPAAPVPALMLGLVGLSNHDNVGACFRNGAAFGVDAVLLDRECADPFYRKAIRVSAGTVLHLAHGWADGWLEMVAAARAAGVEVVALTPKADAPSVAHFEWPERCLVLVGAEGPGLPEACLSEVGCVRIPMATGVDSLNVATAAAVALSHIRR